MDTRPCGDLMLRSWAKARDHPRHAPRLHMGRVRYAPFVILAGTTSGTAQIEQDAQPAMMNTRASPRTTGASCMTPLRERCSTRGQENADTPQRGEHPENRRMIPTAHLTATTHRDLDRGQAHRSHGVPARTRQTQGPTSHPTMTIRPGPGLARQRPRDGQDGTSRCSMTHQLPCEEMTIPHAERRMLMETSDRSFSKEPGRFERFPRCIELGSGSVASIYSRAQALSRAFTFRREAAPHD